MAQGFCDYSDAHYKKDTEWQHMCSACASLPSEVQAWRDRYEARRQRACKSEADRQAERTRLAEAAEDAAIEAAIEEAEIEAAIEAAEQQPQGGASAAEPEEAAVEQEPPRAAEPQKPRFMQHGEQRIDLGRPLWSDVAAKMPRIGQDGSLRMPQHGASVDLKALVEEDPRVLVVAVVLVKAQHSGELGTVWSSIS